jgi:hypothetical protein
VPLHFACTAGEVERGIWLLDLSLDWHYLCASFSDYLRLAIAHLGLVQWPYALTPLGVSPQHEVTSAFLTFYTHVRVGYWL